MPSDLNEIWEKLKTERDELRVQAHLAKAEFKDEWGALEDKWEDAEKKLDGLQQDAVELTGEVKNSLEVVFDELGAAYGRIRARLADED